MSDYNEHSSPTSSTYRNDPVARLLTTDREQLVIVVPDSMNIDPIDLGWLDRNYPFHCRIMKLGKPKGHMRFSIGEDPYRDILRKLIAAGVKTIHNDSLEDTNMKYLELHPGAEGVRVWRPKQQGDK